jgi:CBS domain protein
MEASLSLGISEFVYQYLLRYDHTLYPVSRDGEFVGVITLEDVRELRRDLWGMTSVGAVARPPQAEQVIEDSQDSWNALIRMLENNTPRLLVMRDGRLEGVISRDAVARLVQRKLLLGLPGETGEPAPRRRPSRKRVVSLKIDVDGRSDYLEPLQDKELRRA